VILDAHVHVFPPELIVRRAELVRREPAFGLLYGPPKARLAPAEELVAALDRSGVAAAVACGFPWQDPGLAKAHNDYLLAAAERWPGRILPLAAVDPTVPGGLAEAGRALAQGAAGLGELGFYDRDLAEPEVREALVQAARLCAEAGRPLLLHANEPVGHAYPGKCPMGLAGLYELVKACPATRFQLAHLGGGLFFYEMLKKEVREVLANCVYDTAAAPFLYGTEIYPLFARIAGPTRLLLGSDWPLLGPCRYLRDLAQAGLDEASQELIRGGSAAAWWGWAGRSGAGG
jgi:predicted TIM-barrel fold metal-dependent hydrolase